ncbi:hypothetical protein BDZ45DRAFT_133677 [Acephala macrosclerotiorum]|nr:hypothetical protein BDZ45DRAFT_133677 [Acephala macrosclerotiorum]
MNGGRQAPVRNAPKNANTTPSWLRVSSPSSHSHAAAQTRSLITLHVRIPDSASVMSIYYRHTLSKAEQRDLERKQFNNISLEVASAHAFENDQWDGFCADFSEQKLREMLNQPSIDTQHVKLNKRDVLYIFCDAAGLDPERSDYHERWTLTKPTVRTYAQCICRYVNERRIRFVPSPSPDPNSGNIKSPAGRARSRSPVSGNRRYRYRKRDPIEPVRTSDPNQKSCAVIAPEDYDLILSRTNPGARASEITKILTALNATGDNFWSLDYLFVPFEEQDRKHWILMGIAPKQKFFFIIDPVTAEYERNGPEGSILLQIAFNQWLTRPDDGPKNWPLYGQWARRGHTTDGSPDVIRQADGYNCGVYAVTNLFCLAFGFDLLCYETKDLTPLKRPNMVEELRNGGFGKNRKFEYSLLDLPGNHYTLFDPKLKASSYYPDRGHVDPGQGSGGGNIGRMAASFSPLVDPIDTADDDEDMGEQHALPPVQLTAAEIAARVVAGLLRQPRQLKKSEITELLGRLGGHEPCNVCNGPNLLNVDPGDFAGSDDELTDDDDGLNSDISEGDDGETPEPILTAEEQYAAFRRILDGPDTEEKDDFLEQLKEIDNAPWPPQFDKYRHQKAGFIYANITLPDGCGEVLPSTRKFLRDGCRKFPITGVKEWRTTPRAAIKIWAESEMSAFMARALEEVETKPYPGIGRGYERWKAGLGEVEQGGGSGSSSESTVDDTAEDEAF